MAKQYYVLVQWIDDGWYIQFGDYSRATVMEEMADILDHDVKRKHLKVLQTSDAQAAINLAVSKLGKLS